MIEPPEHLPVVQNLSVSSVATYLKCPERWRRRYVLNEYEPPSGASVLGSAVHEAELQGNYVPKFASGVDAPEADVVDLFSDSFDLRAEQPDVDWGQAKPGKLKDAGVGLVQQYHRTIAPRVVPVAVERKLVVPVPGASWGFVGYTDVETTRATIVDIKVRGKALAQAEADAEIQPTGYLAAKALLGEPAAAFEYHALVRKREPDVGVVITTRTPAQLANFFTHRLYSVARDLAWRVENDAWQGAAPGSWWCSAGWCGFWDTCPWGGAR